MLSKIYTVLICSALFGLVACEKGNNGLKAYNENEILFDKQITVINLWASWCEPCRKEIPELSQLAKDNPDIRVVGIALDKRENVEKFLQSNPVVYPIRYHSKDATEIMLKFGNKSAGIPYTMVYAPQCGFKKSRVGPVSAKEIKTVLEEAKKQCNN